MMEYFRASTGSLAIKIILVLIVLSFIAGGLGSYFIGGSTDYVAKVNGEKISQAQLEQSLQNARYRLQQQLGENFSALADNKNYMQQLRKQVLDQLINNILIAQYTHHLGLKIDDGQIKEFIRKIPYFQTDNQFDNKKYLNLINNMGYTADEFAQLQRQQLINEQLLQAFVNSEFVLPHEIQKIASLLLQKRHLRLATLDLNTFAKKQKVTDKEITDYYDKNKNTFIEPEQVKISFITMHAQSMKNKITVNESEIKDFYEQHSASFVQPELKNYSVIQLKTKEEAENTLNELKKGAHFSELAKKRSTDSISRRKGGQLGWLEPDTTVNEIKQAHLTKKGQLSGIIKSPAGYLILRLNDIKPSYIKPLSMVRDELLERVKRRKTIDAYYVLEEKVREALVNHHQSLAAAEAVSGSKAQRTGWFNRNGVPSEIDSQSAIKTIFDGSLFGTENQPGAAHLIELQGHRALVIRVDGHKPQSIKPLEKVRDQIQKQLQAQKAQEQILVEGKKILGALQEGKGATLMTSAGLSFSEKKAISYNSDDSVLVESVFALNLPKKNRPVYGFSLDQNNNGVLIEFLSITEGKLTSNEKPAFMNNIKAAYNMSDLEALINNLRKEADIKIESLEQ